MALDLQKLVFDEAEVASSDQVGAHILGSASAKVSSTNVGGKEGLDVNVINAISIALDSEFAEDAAHADGDVGQHVLAVRQDTLSASTSADGDYSSFKVNSVGELYVHDADLKAEMVLANASLDAIEASVAAIDVDTSSIITELQSVNTELDSQTALLTTIDSSLDAIEASVAAIDIDTSSIITELQAANSSLDNIEASVASIAAEDFATETTLAAIKAQTDQFTFNAGRLEVLADIDLESDVADDDADTENPLKIGSRAVDGLLPAISASGDKANVVSDMYRRIYVNDAPNVGAAYGAESVTTSAAQIAASPLAGRTRIIVQHNGNQNIYIGFDASVTTTNGLKVAPGAVLDLAFGEDLDLFAIAQSGTQNIRVIQIA